MTRTLSNQTVWGTVVTRAAAGVAVVLGLAGPALGQGHALEGVWGVVTQDRDCTTDAPRGTPTRAVVTYHARGTVSESRYIPVFATGQLSEGHGTWDFTGATTYAGRVLTMVNFDTVPPALPVFKAGWQVATQTIVMTGPDTFTMTGRSEFFNLNQEVYRVGCASRVGERFK